MPLRHDSGHMAPLVRIRHLSKSNCRVDKLNCAHMVTEGQRTTKSLKRFLSGLQRLLHMFSSAMLIAKNPHRRDEVIDLWDFMVWKKSSVEGSEALWFRLDDSTAAGWTAMKCWTALKCVRAVDSFKEVMWTEKTAFNRNITHHFLRDRCEWRMWC